MRRSAGRTERTRNAPGSTPGSTPGSAGRISRRSGRNGRRPLPRLPHCSALIVHHSALPLFHHREQRRRAPAPLCCIHCDVCGIICQVFVWYSSASRPPRRPRGACRGGLGAFRGCFGASLSGFERQPGRRRASGSGPRWRASANTSVGGYCRERAAAAIRTVSAGFSR